MTSQLYPSLNDIEPSWSDIAIDISAVGSQPFDIVDIEGIKWNRKVEVGKRRGASGGRVLARTTGQLDQEASATFYRSGLRRLLRALASSPMAGSRGNQVIVSIVSFDIHIQHTPPGEINIYETILRGCRYLGDSDDMKEGPDADKIEVDLNPISIVQLLDGREIALL